MLKIDNFTKNNYAYNFVYEFFNNNSIPKYIFGRNEYAKVIANYININGFIDEYTNEKEYLGKPIIPIENIPNNSLVVSIVIGKPFIAEHKLSKFQFKFLDYFSFYNYSKKIFNNIHLKNIEFWEGFEKDFYENRNKYELIYSLLKDNISKNIFYNLINFRLSYDLNYMRGFDILEDKQYFEEFLIFDNNEIFVDIGGYDGYTTEEFIKKCPNYKKVFFFEPEENNLLIAKKRLQGYNNIVFYNYGLSNAKKILKFSSSGSSSKITDDGDIIINVDKLDDLINAPVSFIKMDIEGAEYEALEGALNIIKNYHPKMAISVYHKANDFWKIPEFVLNIRNDYDLYLRHYTQGISETIMFFIPNKL